MSCHGCAAAVLTLAGVPALLADYQDADPAEIADPADDGRIVAVLAVTVQLDELGQHAVDVAPGGRPVRVAGKLNGLPGIPRRPGRWAIELGVSAGLQVPGVMEELEQRCQDVAEARSVDDGVDPAVPVEELGGLGALRRRVAGELLDDPRPGEADQRPGLRQDDVAERGVTRVDTAGRGVGQHRYER